MMRKRFFLLLILKIVGIMIGDLFISSIAMADVRSSKTNAYAVVAPPNAVLVSKTNAYAVVAPPNAVLVSKTNAYAVVAPPNAVLVSKVVAYAVLAPATANQQPNVFIITKSDAQSLPQPFPAIFFGVGSGYKQINYLQNH